jgi:ElaA protein
VFVVEQAAPTWTPTGWTAACLAPAGARHGGALQAYLRVVDPGRKYAEPSIGRVLTAPEVRGSGGP